MKIRVGNDITTGELYLGTQEQIKHYGIHYSERAYYETFVGDCEGYISDKIDGHVEAFRHVIVKSATLTLHFDSFTKEREYTAISTSDVVVLPNYDVNLITKVNELRNSNAPITEAFNFLNLTTADEQAIFAAQWYNKNKKILAYSSNDPELTQLTISTKVTKTYAFNHKLTPEQLKLIEQNIIKNGEFYAWELNKNSSVPDDLKMEYLNGKTTVDKDNFIKKTINSSELIKQRNL